MNDDINLFTDDIQSYISVYNQSVQNVFTHNKIDAHFTNLDSSGFQIK